MSECGTKYPRGWVGPARGARFSLITWLTLVALVGCGDGGSTAQPSHGDRARGTEAGTFADSGSMDHPTASMQDAARIPPAVDSATESSTPSDGLAPPRADAGGDSFRFPEHAPPGCVPDCLWRLLAECTPPPTATCQHEAHPGDIRAVCYSSGHRSVTQFVPQGTNVGTTYRSDGSLCMTVSWMAALATYRDASGSVVAVTRDLDRDSEMIEVECDGKKAVAEFLSDRCWNFGPGCLPGMCPL